MQRQIKFRVWDGKFGEMYYDISSLDWENIDRTLNVFVNRSQIKKPTLMQFTGLHDKNGLEIYEGDILRDLEGTLGMVEYKHCGFTAKDKAGWDNLEFPNESEVMGNICENPKLLSTK